MKLRLRELFSNPGISAIRSPGEEQAGVSLPLSILSPSYEENQAGLSPSAQLGKRSPCVCAYWRKFDRAPEPLHHAVAGEPGVPWNELLGMVESKAQIDMLTAQNIALRAIRIGNKAFWDYRENQDEHRSMQNRGAGK